jgi:hypothetical protein
MDAIIEQPKPFQWSYSRLSAFETCPRRFYETQIKKDAWPEEKSEMLDFGSAVHIAMANALKNKTPLPTQYRLFQHWIDRIHSKQGELLVEDQCQLACTREMKPTPWFAPNVWLRCVADALVLDPPAAFLIDWKTGKSQNASATQLTLTTLMVFVHFPEVHGVCSEFIWLQEDRKTVQEIRRKNAADHWVEILPRVQRLQRAVEKENFPPSPGRFCRSWCPVKSCEYHGT